VAALTGIQESFGKAAERTLRKLAGIRVCESTVQRTPEAAGERWGDLLAGGAVFGAGRPWDWHRDQAGKTCAYVSLDATGILMQGVGGAKVEGRLVSVGMIFNPQPRRLDEAALSKPCDGARYLAGLYTLEELGLHLRRQATRVQLLERLDGQKLTDAARAALADVLPYLRRHVPRMDYPEYLRRGWQIASGAVESACKPVVNQRLCLGGMRWGEAGSDAVAHPRALYRSDPDQWDAFWGYAMAA